MKPRSTRVSNLHPTRHKNRSQSWQCRSYRAPRWNSNSWFWSIPKLPCQQDGVPQPSSSPYQTMPSASQETCVKEQAKPYMAVSYWGDNLKPGLRNRTQVTAETSQDEWQARPRCLAVETKPRLCLASDDRGRWHILKTCDDWQWSITVSEADEW